MTREQFDELDYSFHFDGEPEFEAWMHDPETLEMLAECDRLYEGVDQ